ncbi:MAG TPA: hypothetical protein VGQ37_23630 [Vicinamibacterales bacterium]|jgi:hypothetical protein|nr:hypothetical protein [Vicinamibacterales bacterium]
MSAGGRHRRPGDESDGLGAFASETDGRQEPAPSHPFRQAGRRALDSPVLVPIVVALAVVVYGGLTVLWWERDRPEIKPSFSSTTPTRSFRPSAPQASPAAESAPGPAVAVNEAVPPDLFVPAVARADAAPRPPEPVASPLPDRALAPVAPDAAEDVPPGQPALIVPPPAPDAAAAAAVAPAGEAAVVAPPRSAEPSAVERLAADRDAIGGVLRSYRAAYNSLDATTASTIWQGLDTRALQKAFSTLTRQDVSFDRCDVRVTAADRAVASCRGVLSYVPKIGDGTPQQRRLAWSFDFQRAADRWMISSVSAR